MGAPSPPRYCDGIWGWPILIAIYGIAALACRWICWTPVTESLHDGHLSQKRVEDLARHARDGVGPAAVAAIALWSYSREFGRWMRIGCYVRRSAIFAPQLRTMVVSITISMTDI